MLQDAAIDIDAGIEHPLLDGAGARDGDDFSGWTVPGMLIGCTLLTSRSSTRVDSARNVGLTLTSCDVSMGQDTCTGS